MTRFDNALETQISFDLIRSFRSGSSSNQHVTLHTRPKSRNDREISGSPFFCWPGLLLLIPTTTCPMLASKDVLSPTLMRPLPGEQEEQDFRTKSLRRYLINFGVFQLRSATVASVGTSSVSATVRFFQNPLIADDDSRYETEIVNMVAGTEYFVCLLPTNTQRATPVLTDFLSNEVMTARDETTPVVSTSSHFPCRTVNVSLYPGTAQRNSALIPTLRTVHCKGFDQSLQHRWSLWEEGHQHNGSGHLQQSLWRAFSPNTCNCQ